MGWVQMYGRYEEERGERRWRGGAWRIGVVIRDVGIRDVGIRDVGIRNVGVWVYVGGCRCVGVGVGLTV